MSFSADLKAELSEVFDNARHCRIAELAAILCFTGETVKEETGDFLIRMSAENPNTAAAAAALLKKLFRIEAAVRQKKSARNLLSCSIELEGAEAAEAAETLKITMENGRYVPDVPRLTEKNCCRRAFLRGAFLSAGSISDPERFYHLEIPCREKKLAEKLVDIMTALHLEARTVERQKYEVVYVKDSTRIADLLGLMGARRTLLELENARIRREVRGNVNRRVNCETANINKAAMAAARQIEDIRYIEMKIGLRSLPNGLDERARIRLQYPEANLSELGSHLDPPVGKSGVNHRLRKIGQIAAALKNQGGS